MNAATILLVDDDEVLSQVLRRVLTRQGYNVINAHNVAQAEELAEQHHPQLGLLDLCLPDGDGVELARRLTEKAANLPLILLTAYPLRLRERPELAAKFNRVLTKPVNLQELRDAIEAALHDSQTNAVHAETTVPAAPAPVRPEPVRSVATPSDYHAEPVHDEHHSPRRRRLVPALAGLVAVAVVLLLAFTGWRLQLYAALPWFKTPAESADNGPPPVSAVPGNPNALAVNKEVVKLLNITTTPVVPAQAHHPLELAGSLTFNTNKLARLRSPFAGEVVTITSVRETGANWMSVPRELRVNDFVAQDEVVAVIWSADFGQKKSDLVDALSQLATDEAYLKKYEQLYEKGGLVPEFTLLQARRNAEQSRLAVRRAENALRTAKMTDDQIEALKKELADTGKPPDPADKEKFKNWASVEIKARFSGSIVEKNVSPGDIVDPTTDLFKIADLTQLVALANVREEDLPVLRANKTPIPWTVMLPSDPRPKPLKGTPLEGQIAYISPIIDPTQHTALALGYVENPNQLLLSAQAITASVKFPDPQNTVALPTSALVEDGNTSVVFVKPDPDKNVYVMKRVKVVKRFADVVHISNDLTEEEARPLDKKGKGLQPLCPALWWCPGEEVVTQNALGLKAALDDLQAK